MAEMHCNDVTWNGRPAFQMSNDVVQFTQLAWGGHIVDVRHASPSGSWSVNPFWTPEWRSIDPFEYDASKHEAIYGPPIIGKTLCGLAGHNLCLDLFGTPSSEEARCGAVVHGEAGISAWKCRPSASMAQCALKCSARLAAAGLHFSRALSLLADESVIRISETVENRRPVDQCFQWQQHVTLGAPFLDRDGCIVSLPGARGITLPSGYEGNELLACASEFEWPYAPGHSGGTCDLRLTLLKKGCGFVAGIKFQPDRQYAFVCAMNKRSNLLIGYYFRRSDFPWVALWEENLCRNYPPWNGNEQTRGLEFGASPLPSTRKERLLAGPLFNTPTMAYLPAKSKRVANYLMFLMVPDRLQSVSDIRLEQNHLRLIDEDGINHQLIAARGVEAFLA